MRQMAICCSFTSLLFSHPLFLLEHITHNRMQMCTQTRSGNHFFARREMLCKGAYGDRSTHCVGRGNNILYRLERISSGSSNTSQHPSSACVYFLINNLTDLNKRGRESKRRLPKFSCFSLLHIGKSVRRALWITKFTCIGTLVYIHSCSLSLSACLLSLMGLY
jgi:hypothetical protein